MKEFNRKIDGKKENILGISAKEYWNNEHQYNDKVKRKYNVMITDTPYFDYDEVFRKK